MSSSLSYLLRIVFAIATTVLNTSGMTRTDIVYNTGYTLMYRDIPTTTWDITKNMINSIQYKERCLILSIDQK